MHKECIIFRLTIEVTTADNKDCWLTLHVSDKWGGWSQISGGALLRKWSLFFFSVCSHQLIRCVGREGWSSGSPWLLCGTSTITMSWAQAEREAHICTIRCVVQVSGEVRVLSAGLWCFQCGEKQPFQRLAALRWASVILMQFDLHYDFGPYT